MMMMRRIIIIFVTVFHQLFRVCCLGNWDICRLWIASVDCVSFSAACCSMLLVLQVQAMSVCNWQQRRHHYTDCITLFAF